MNPKKTVHRKEYPPIYEKINKGRTYYVVKCKRAGWTGKKEEWFKKLSDARARASEIAGDVAKRGIKEAAFDDMDRYWLLKGKEMLQPYGVSFHDCFTREVEYQKSLLKKQKVGTVEELVNEWLHERRTFKYKKVSDRTLEELRDRGQDLVNAFGSKKIIDVTHEIVDTYLTSLKVGFRTKNNRKNKINQFFRWCKFQKKQITDSAV